MGKSLACMVAQRNLWTEEDGNVSSCPSTSSSASTVVDSSSNHSKTPMRCEGVVGDSLDASLFDVIDEVPAGAMVNRILSAQLVHGDICYFVEVQRRHQIPRVVAIRAPTFRLHYAKEIIKFYRAKMVINDSLPVDLPALAARAVHRTKKLDNALAKKYGTAPSPAKKPKMELVVETPTSLKDDPATDADDEGEDSDEESEYEEIPISEFLKGPSIR